MQSRRLQSIILQYLRSGTSVDAESEVKNWRHIEILDKHVDQIFVAEICELIDSLGKALPSFPMSTQAHVSWWAGPRSAIRVRYAHTCVQAV
jgi:hypothetical protein